MIEESGLYEIYRPRRRGLEHLRFVIRRDTSDVKAIEEVIERNSYQRPRLGFIVEAGERWLDAGANVGAFAVLVHAIGGAPVCAVEADKANSLLAASNIDRNGAGDVCEVRCAAVVPDAYEATTVPLHTNTAPLALRRHSILRARRESSPVDVPARRISDLIVEHGVEAVKLNIEGVELDILAGPDRWDPPPSVSKLVLEWSFDVDPSIARLRLAVDRLQDRFPRVVLSKRIDWEAKRWAFYPPNLFIFAWR